jgi:hypothetical protein
VLESTTYADGHFEYTYENVSQGNYVFLATATYNQTAYTNSTKFDVKGKGKSFYIIFDARKYFVNETIEFTVFGPVDTDFILNLFGNFINESYELKTNSSGYTSFNHTFSEIGTYVLSVGNSKLEFTINPLNKTVQETTSKELSVEAKEKYFLGEVAYFLISGPPNESFSVEIVGPTNSTIYFTELKTDSFGKFEFPFNQTILGKHLISLEYMNNTISKEFEVIEHEEIEEGIFKISLDKNTYLQNETMNALITGKSNEQVLLEIKSDTTDTKHREVIRKKSAP